MPRISRSTRPRWSSRSTASTATSSSIFKYVVETDRRFYLCNEVDVKVRTEAGDVFFEVTMTDAWVWDMYRPARFAKNVKVLTFKDVNVEELSPAGHRPAEGLTAPSARLPGHPPSTGWPPGGCPQPPPPRLSRSVRCDPADAVAPRRSDDDRALGHGGDSRRSARTASRSPRGTWSSRA